MKSERIINFFKEHAKATACLLIASLGFYLRIERLAHRDLWNDELYQFAQTSGPFKAIWQRHTYGDMTCFPGDYLLTYPFIKIFGLNKWGLAIPHMLITMIGFYFLYLICRRYFKTMVGYIVAFSIVCFNQHLIFHSFELRPYAVLPTLTLMAVYLTDILVSQYAQLSRVGKYSIGVFLIFTIWFHAFGVLIILFPLVYFLLLKRNDASWYQDIKPLAQFFFFVFSIALPLWLWYVTGNPGKINRNTFDYIPNPLDGFWRFFNYTVFYHLIGFKKLYFLLGGFIFMVFIPYQDKLKKISFFLILVLLPIEIILFADLTNGYWFLIRQYIYIAPLLAFFLGWLWDSSVYYFFDKEKRVFNFSSVIGLILLGICTIGGLVGWVF